MAVILAEAQDSAKEGTPAVVLALSYKNSNMWVRNMENTKLNKWAELLLDTGKRNRLVNFQDAKASTVEIVCPDSSVVFEKASGTSSLEVFDPKLADDEIDTSDTVIGEELEAAESSERSATDKMDRATYISVYGNKLRKASQVLLYNKTMNPLTALKNIHKKAKSALDETGVNVAYLAFGFIHWKENEHSHTTYRAPILLAPIAFKHESAISPYYIEFTGDDIVTNPTFSYKLFNDFGVKLPEYNDEGLDEYLEAIRHVVRKFDWQVTSECKVGIFSFLKMNMYRDLVDNADSILQSSNIQRLLGDCPDDERAVHSEATPSHVGNEIIDLHTVVDADSSQIEAIELAKSGASFVLQGPPGTGKSQTITNIIAESLYDGKKVLFVSEKQAALNVVYDKLKKAGLEEFCLELHSYKANKKDVIAELCHTLRSARSTVSSRAETEVELKAKAQKQLDDYAVELHKQRDVIGKSLYQLFEAYASTSGIPDMDYSIPDITAKGEGHLIEAQGLLEQYAGFVPTIGYDYHRNVWYGYINRAVSYQEKADFSAQLSTAADGVTSMVAGADEAQQKYHIVCKTMDDCAVAQSLMELLSQTDIITPAFFADGNLAAVSNSLQPLKESSASLLSIRSELMEAFESEFFEIDARETHKKLTKLYSGFFSRLFNAEYKELINSLRLMHKGAGKLNYHEAVFYTEKLSDYNDSLTAFRNAEKAVVGILGPAFCGEDTNWNSAIAQVERLVRILDCGLDCSALANLSNAEFEEAKTSFAAIASTMQRGIARCEPVMDSLAASFHPESFSVSACEIHELEARFNGCIHEFEQLENWNRFSALLAKIQEIDATAYLEYVIGHNVPVSQIVDGYKRIFYRQWIETIIRNSTTLANFTRISQDQAIRTFAQKDVLQFEISKAQIKAELSAKRPSLDYVSSGSAVSTLLREGEKKRKQKPIRQLLEEIGELTQLLKPCFLMSPLSVSTFLSNEAIRFDTVIFDEASQIFPQDAVGAIYRGKQLIVVGDSKQMPPSNFFNAAVDSDSDDDSDDIADFESILDLCSAALPHRQLSWHYRSRFEQLIAFSNKNFYDNTLITFPSAKADKTGVGVDYFPVDGLFDHRSRTNRAEAEFVVELIYRNADIFPERSLGVVAFSIAQQDLIERLLAKRRQEDPSKEPFFAENTKEPFFIKNLETVQGDERDTIIFSTAYGKDAQGRLLHNFGPLNRIGGERRLNVAVSRAKCNVQVVSSMHYTDIDLKRTQSDGARLLREYLDFAENGMPALERSLNVNPFEQFDSAFEMEVFDYLKSKGYDVDTQVGCSGYKIDIGLKRPSSSDYVLAIECDGATYHSSKNARDRDRLRQSVLESMGWNFYRIWSTDWFKNNQEEKRRLIDACEDAFVSLPKISPTNDKRQQEAKATAFEEARKESHPGFPVYKMAPNPPSYANNLQEEILKILQVEAPISEEWLLKRIAYLFGREKVTNVVWESYAQQMRGCEARGIIRRNGFLYLNGKSDYVLRIPGEYKRDIKYIALEELAAGIYAIVKQNVTANKEGVFTTITNQLGFTRRGDSIRTRLNQSLGLLSNIIRDEDGTLSLK